MNPHRSLYRAVGAGLKPARSPCRGPQPSSSSPHAALHKAISTAPKPNGPLYRAVGAGLKPARSPAMGTRNLSRPVPGGSPQGSSHLPGVPSSFRRRPEPSPKGKSTGVLPSPRRPIVVPAQAGTQPQGGVHRGPPISQASHRRSGAGRNPAPRGSPQGFSPLAGGLGVCPQITPPPLGGGIGTRRTPRKILRR